MVTFVTEHRRGVVSGEDSLIIPRGGSEAACFASPTWWVLNGLSMYSTSKTVTANATVKDRFLTALSLLLAWFDAEQQEDLRLQKHRLPAICQLSDGHSGLLRRQRDESGKR